MVQIKTCIIALLYIRSVGKSRPPVTPTNAEALKLLSQPASPASSSTTSPFAPAVPDLALTAPASVVTAAGPSPVQDVMAVSRLTPSKHPRISHFSNQPSNSSIVSDITEESIGGNSRISSKLTLIEYPGSTSNKATSTDDLSKEANDVYAPVSLNVNSGFYARLHSSENQLYTLFEAFRSVIGSNERAKLLAAATMGTSPSVMAMATKMFVSVTKELEILRGLAATVEIELTKCEEMAQNLIVLFGSSDIHDENVQRSSERLMRLLIPFSVTALVYINCFIIFFSILGKSSVSLIGNRILLTEYRSLFENVSGSEAQRFSRLLKSCPEFEQSYQCFLDCQGRLVR